MNVILKEELISIVVPVYNVQLYLDQCLKSIAKQTYRNIEVIIINDGSTDKSLDICEQWIAKDKRMRIVSQNNKGLGPTRNLGISLAKGIYITFVDSDDWLHKDYIKELYNKIVLEDAEICTCSFQRYNNQEKLLEQVIKCSEKVVNDNFEVHPNIWGRIYKKDLFIRGNIKMPAIPYEDLATYPNLEGIASKITCIDKVLYYYRVNTGKSIMDNLNNVNFYVESLTYLVNDSIRLNLFNYNKSSLMIIAVMSMKYGLLRVRGKWSNEEYYKLLNSFKDFLDKYFEGWRKIYENRFYVLGSYNLSRSVNNIMLEYDITNKQTKYYGYSSIISIMSSKINRKAPYHENKFRMNMLDREFDKSLKESKIKENDYIILDFLEERYDLIKCEDSYITKSEILEESSYRVEEDGIINRDSRECKILWEKSCLEFIEFLRNNFKLEKIILVEMYLCREYELNDGMNSYKCHDEIYNMNNILYSYYRFFEKNLPGIKIIKIPEKLIYSNYNFKYGCKPCYINSKAVQLIMKSIYIDLIKAGEENHE